MALSLPLCVHIFTLFDKQRSVAECLSARFLKRPPPDVVANSTSAVLSQRLSSIRRVVALCRDDSFEGGFWKDAELRKSLSNNDIDCTATFLCYAIHYGFVSSVGFCMF